MDAPVVTELICLAHSETEHNMHFQGLLNAETEWLGNVIVVNVK